METHSTNSWIVALKSGNEDAAQELWNKYEIRLAALAKRHLSQRRASLDDEDDVANKAFQSLVLRVEKGQFPRLDTKENFWSILACIACRRAWKTNREGGKRIIPKPMSMDVPLSDGESETTWANQISADDLGPHDILVMEKTIEEMMDVLDDDELREVAILRYEGRAVLEIASEIQRSKATVERRLKLIRKIWSAEFPEIAVLFSEE